MRREDPSFGADRLETDRVNLAEAQNEITGRLARTLNVELVQDAARRIEREAAVDPDARDLVMRGWALYHRLRSPATLRPAQRAFEHALEIDPGSVDARIGIATIMAQNMNDDRRHLPEAARGRPHRLGCRDNRRGRQHRWQTRNRRAPYRSLGSRDVLVELSQKA